MPLEDGVVQPVVTNRTPRLGPLAFVAATHADVQLLRRSFQLPDTRELYLSRLYFKENALTTPAIAGPVMGAPYAVMVLETLRAWGARTIVFLGWCGSIQKRLRTGDILLPDSAVIDEGTSTHYAQQTGDIVRPHGPLYQTLNATLVESEISHSTGRVWSTDGIFRETPTQINKFQNHGAVAVEMELSALCSAAQFHALSLAALLVVSDELFSLKWEKGFQDSRFKQSRIAICNHLAQRYRSLYNGGHSSIGDTA